MLRRSKPVDEAAHRDRFDFDEGGQFVLRHARLTLQTHKDHPLRACHSVIAGARIGECAHQPRNVGQDDQGIAFEGFMGSPNVG